MVVGFCRRCFGSSFAALSALQFAVPLAARQFVVTIAVRSWWLCVSVKAEPVEVHKESGIISRFNSLRARSIRSSMRWSW
jgi:hypothetical protein